MEVWGTVKRFRWFIYAGVSIILSIVLLLDAEGFVGRIDALLGPHPQRLWPTVQGTVLSTEFQCRDPSTGESYWVVIVRFAYRVRGSGYLGEQEIQMIEAVSLSDIEAGSRTWRVIYSTCSVEDFLALESLETVQETLEERLLYRSGQQVPVYYNPDNPGEAVIKPGAIFGYTNVTYGEAIVLYTALALCFGGIGMLIAGIQRLGKGRLPTLPALL